MRIRPQGQQPAERQTLWTLNRPSTETTRLRQVLAKAQADREVLNNILESTGNADVKLPRFQCKRWTKGGVHVPSIITAPSTDRYTRRPKATAIDVETWIDKRQPYPSAVRPNPHRKPPNSFN